MPFLYVVASMIAFIREQLGVVIKFIRGLFWGGFGGNLDLCEFDKGVHGASF